MMNACTFLDELLRNRLYMDTGYTILIASCFIIGLAAFGCIGERRNVVMIVLRSHLFSGLQTDQVSPSYLHRLHVPPVRSDGGGRCAGLHLPRAGGEHDQG